MANFFETVTKDIGDAMKRRDMAELSALRMLKAALMNKEVEKGRALDQAESLQVVSSLIKQRRDSIEQFRAGNRNELADKEQAERRQGAREPGSHLQGRRGHQIRAIDYR